MATVTELQEFLFDTLKGIRDGSVNTDKAKAITSVANAMVSSAKVEVDFANAVGNVDSKFLQRQEYKPGIEDKSGNQESQPVVQMIEQEKSITAKGGVVEKDGAVTRHTLR